jgi:hypothetical protein
MLSSSVRYPTTNWLADRWEEVEDRRIFRFAHRRAGNATPLLLRSTDKSEGISLAILPQTVTRFESSEQADVCPHRLGPA